MRIGEVGERAGVSPKTIRYYEQIGLVPEPHRRPNGYRDYEGSSVGLLRFIRAAQSIGLSLVEIREVLAFRDRAEQPCDHVLEVIERHVEDLGERIRALESMRQSLVRLLDGGGFDRHSAAYCHIIESAITPAS
jgi:DNA-binding transcriptional MerR regulator